MTLPHTRHPIVEIKCPGALTIVFRSQQNTRAHLASIELPQIQFLGNESVCFSKINADTHESHMEKSREPPKTKMLLYQLKWAVCLRKIAQVIIENQPQQRKKKHTTDAEPHIKNQPDQKSLCPLRIYPLIADTYGRPAQSVLTTKPLICVRLVAENFKEAVLIIPPPREQLNPFC